MRVASRLGLKRTPRDVTQSWDEIAAEIHAADAAGGGDHPP